MADYNFLEQVISLDFEYVPRIERIVRALDFLLGRILGLTPVHTPLTKRARMENGEANLSVHYMATFRTWIGRRQIRRNIAKEHPTLSFIEQERMVFFYLKIGVHRRN